MVIQSNESQIRLKVSLRESVVLSQLLWRIMRRRSRICFLGFRRLLIFLRRSRLVYLLPHGFGEYETDMSDASLNISMPKKKQRLS